MQKNPTKRDVHLRNNMLHIRTCADSMRAIAEIINYVASNMDLQDPDDDTTPTGAEAPHMPVSDTTGCALSYASHVTESGGVCGV